MMRETSRTVMMQKLLALGFVVAIMCLPTSAFGAFSSDFNSDDGGFTVLDIGPVDNSWEWQAGSWLVAGTSNSIPNASILSSPVFSVTQDRPLLMEFDHRYSFEYDGVTRWDGGQIRLSINGGAYSPIPGTSFISNGYIGTIQGANILFGQEGFNGDSQGYDAGSFITSELSLGTFSIGDQLSVQFVAACDQYVTGSIPNWEIDRVQIGSTSAVPAPGALLLGGIGTCIVSWFRRRRLA